MALRLIGYLEDEKYDSRVEVGSRNCFRVEELLSQWRSWKIEPFDKWWRSQMPR